MSEEKGGECAVCGREVLGTKMVQPTGKILHLSCWLHTEASRSNGYKPVEGVLGLPTGTELWSTPAEFRSTPPKRPTMLVFLQLLLGFALGLGIRFLLGVSAY